MKHLKILKNSTLSTKEIAEKLGVSDRAIQMYLNGQRNIPRPTQKLIDYIFNDKENSEMTSSIIELKKQIEELTDRIKMKNEVIVSLNKSVDLLEDYVDLLKLQLAKANRDKI